MNSTPPVKWLQVRLGASVIAASLVALPACSQSANEENTRLNALALEEEEGDVEDCPRDEAEGVSEHTTGLGTVVRKVVRYDGDDYDKQVVETRTWSNPNYDQLRCPSVDGVSAIATDEVEDTIDTKYACYEGEWKVKWRREASDQNSTCPDGTIVAKAPSVKVEEYHVPWAMPLATFTSKNKSILWTSLGGPIRSESENTHWTIDGTYQTPEGVLSRRPLANGRVNVYRTPTAADARKATVKSTHTVFGGPGVQPGHPWNSQSEVYERTFEWDVNGLESAFSRFGRGTNVEFNMQGEPVTVMDEGGAVAYTASNPPGERLDFVTLGLQPDQQNACWVVNALADWENVSVWDWNLDAERLALPPVPKAAPAWQHLRDEACGEVEGPLG